jgi:probable phosphoglycerate mutase
MPERNSTRLFLVRHGATQLSAEDRFAGSTDVELSEEGIFQAERLAARLADDSISAVYSSPLKRTLHTAQILAGPHDLTPIIRDGLREIDHGHWEGMTRAEVESRFAEEYAAWEEDPTFASRRRRRQHHRGLCRDPGSWYSIAQKHPGRRTATLRLLISACSASTGAAATGSPVPYMTCSTRVWCMRLMLFNDVSHYMDHPRSGEDCQVIG